MFGRQEDGDFDLVSSGGGGGGGGGRGSGGSVSRFLFPRDKRSQEQLADVFLPPYALRDHAEEGGRDDDDDDQEQEDLDADEALDLELWETPLEGREADESNMRRSTEEFFLYRKKSRDVCRTALEICICMLISGKKDQRLFYSKMGSQYVPRVYPPVYPPASCRIYVVKPVNSTDILLRCSSPRRCLSRFISSSLT